VTYTLAATSAGFDSLRIGGPSGVTSPGPGYMAFDNILLKLVNTSLTGDWNNDGHIDQADYVTWRLDPVGHGGDPGGWNAWRGAFATAGSGSGLSGSAIPEPTALGLAIVGLVAFAGHWAKRVA
jgi:hypothetical protein